MRNKWLWISTLMLAIVILIAACAQPTPTPTEPEPTADEIEALIIERCSECHSADRVFQADYDADGWSEEIDDMIRKGAEVSEEEKALMIEWLISR